MKRHRAGSATYPGDARAIVGEIKGPLTFGGLVVAESAAFDGSTTTVTFGHMRREDVAGARLDDHGLARVAAVTA